MKKLIILFGVLATTHTSYTTTNYHKNISYDTHATNSSAAAGICFLIGSWKLLHGTYNIFFSKPPHEDHSLLYTKKQLVSYARVKPDFFKILVQNEVENREHYFKECNRILQGCLCFIVGYTCLHYFPNDCYVDIISPDPAVTNITSPNPIQ